MPFDASTAAIRVGSYFLPPNTPGDVIEIVAEQASWETDWRRISTARQRIRNGTACNQAVLNNLPDSDLEDDPEDVAARDDTKWNALVDAEREAKQRAAAPFRGRVISFDPWPVGETTPMQQSSEPESVYTMASPAIQPRRAVATDADALLDWMCAHAWAALDIPPEPRMLGDLLTSTSRVFIIGSTGLGKTQLAHGIAVGVASGAGFLHWRTDRPRRVLLVDGEMSTSLIKDRIVAALQRSLRVAARNLVIYGLDRSEEFASRFPGLGLFQPLNTKAGQQFMLQLIDLIKPDCIIFDNVMSLIAGDQKDEIPWSETMPLVSTITARGICQVWLDHTGHDRSRQYGSATKAWHFDAVGIMSAVESAADGEIAFQLSFDDPGKARRRTPANWQDFAPRLITLAGDEWVSQPVGKRATPGGGVQHVRPSYEAWYDVLHAISAPSGQATLDEWLAAGIRKGLTDAIRDDDTRTTKETKRLKFSRSRSALVSAGWVEVTDETACDLLNGAKPVRGK